MDGDGWEFMDFYKSTDEAKAAAGLDGEKILTDGSHVWSPTRRRSYVDTIIVVRWRCDPVLCTLRGKSWKLEQWCPLSEEKSSPLSRRVPPPSRIQDNVYIVYINIYIYYIYNNNNLHVVGRAKNLEKRVQDCSRKFKISAIRARPPCQNLS